MPITIKTGKLKYRKSNGTYDGFDAISNTTTEEQVAAINLAGQVQTSLVEGAGATQITSIQNKGEEVLDSIPEDYSALSADVAALKSASDNLFYVTDRTDRTINGVQFTFHDDGSFTASGTATETINMYIMGDTTTATPRLSGNTTYTCTRWIVSGSGNVCLRNVTASTNIITGTDAYMRVTITPSADTKVCIQIGNNVSVDGTFRFQIEDGSAASDYSPALPEFANDAIARMRVADLNRAYTARQMISIEYRTGLDSSLYHGASEGLFIRIGSVKYVLVHSIDASKKCNCWRMWRAVSENEKKSLTTNGEWECVIRMSGWGDFSGGYIHGNEMMSAMSVYVDSVETALADLSSGVDGYSVRIAESSVIYSNIDPSTPVANHGKEYLFTSEGLIISQSLDWLVNGTLGKCYLAMLPCAKAYAEKYYTDTKFEMTNMPSTDNYSITYPDAQNVQIYGANAAYIFGIRKYPDGLTNGNALLITDNYVSTATSYHKCYYRVCDGGDIEVGALWKSETKYDLSYIK